MKIDKFQVPDDWDDYDRYQDTVIEYLEYIDYPYWVSQFRPEDVARAMFHSMLNFHANRISPRMAAISIFSLTYQFQVIRPINKSTEIVH